MLNCNKKDFLLIYDFFFILIEMCSWTYFIICSIGSDDGFWWRAASGGCPTSPTSGTGDFFGVLACLWVISSDCLLMLPWSCYCHLTNVCFFSHIGIIRSFNYVWLFITLLFLSINILPLTWYYFQLPQFLIYDDDNADCDLSYLVLFYAYFFLLSFVYFLFFFISRVYN